MLICTHCNYQNREGTLICERCHSPFWSDEPTPRLLAPRASTPLPHPAYHLQASTSNYKLILKPSLLFQLKKDLANGELILGRAEPSFNLSALRVNLPNAAELGVSRLHAALIPFAEGVGLQDLGSTNGTYLNGQRLPDRRVYLLADRDMISLGQFRMVVHLDE